MKTLITCSALFLLALPAFGQAGNPNYDSTLAARLGADEMGMKKFYLVLLRTGSAQVEDKAVRDSLFAGHFANMKRMVDQKKLIVAGPIGGNDKQLRGIFIIDAASPEEVLELLEGDLAVKAKMLEPEVYPWYGSAALPEYLPAADKIWKKSP
jgi:uncharacterized protein YciI